MNFYREIRDSFHTWYYTSPGWRNIRTLIYNDYSDPTQEPRSKYQIDRFECWRTSCYMLCVPATVLAAYNGYRLANEQFAKANELMIYESRLSMWRIRSNMRYMAVLGYSFPVMLRTLTFVTCLLGVPALLGVYHNDTDKVRHYALSSSVGAVLVSTMTTSNEFRGARQKLVAGFLGLIPGLFAGVLFTQAQKRDLYPFYDNYQQRWRELDPLWAKFTDKVREEEIARKEGLEAEQNALLQRRLEEEQITHLEKLEAQRRAVSDELKSEERILLTAQLDNNSDEVL